MAKVKKVLGWSAGIIVGLAVLSNIGDNTEELVKEEEPKTEVVEKAEPKEADPVVEEPKEEPKEEVVEEPKEEKPQYTVSQENAIRHAEQYIDTMPFSKSGLKGQLEYEGYSSEDSQFAVDTIQVDWRAQAVRHAKQYLETMPMSKQGLIDQLIYEGHSQEDATFAATEVGL